MSEMEEKEIKGENGKVYELGYLLVPTIAQEDVPARYGDLKSLIMATFKGEIISDEIPKTMTLAYPMQKVVSNVRSKFDTAYFGWTKFTMEVKNIVELKKHLDLDPNIIRFIILKTVKENTIATKRFVTRGAIKRPLVNRKPDEVLTPINKEEVDKEIDALVATQ